MNDYIRTLPLKTKLLSIIILAFVLLTVILAGNLSFNLANMKQDLVTQTRQTMEQEVLARLDSEASKLGNQIGGFINGIYRIPISVANTLADSIKNESHRMNRHQVNELVHSHLASHNDISAIYAQFEANGSVDLYHNNVKKFETTSTGISVTGNGAFSENIFILDNKYAKFGTSEDFIVGHNGTDTLLRNYTGEYRIDQSAVTKSIVFRTSNANSLDTTAVSYTHLTLPTIYSV